MVFQIQGKTCFVTTFRHSKLSVNDRQYRDHQRRARSAEDLLEIINALGDATTEELRERCDEKLEEYLKQLQQQGRITNFNFPLNGETQPRWVSVEKKALYEEMF